MLKIEDFPTFYKQVHGFDPFPWQIRVAQNACKGIWHDLNLPTAVGKTSALDAAIFSLAIREGQSPRRIFFVVDRRIVVDQAFEHAKKISHALEGAESGIVRHVADVLRGLAQDNRPLDVYSLRGGLYRESIWARTPLQPTIITSTVDQVGSRLLFRGYGVSNSMKPIHAALVGNDSLIFLDEAQNSKAFEQTLQSVKKYRNDWGKENPSRPFHIVSMTATPNRNSHTETVNEDDLTHPVLGKRITTSKLAKLVVAQKAKGKVALAELAKQMEKEARNLAKDGECVGIIVNRVATARLLKKHLGESAVLLTGRMRPIDRDKVMAEKLLPLLPNYAGSQKPPKFVIGTQCLECGADFDFHALVTECASLDALRQRFGRLNRVAKRDRADAVIVIREDQAKPKADDSDPIYGKSLFATWEWISSKAIGNVIDFGSAQINKMIKDVDLSLLNCPSEDAPQLLPAFLDAWVQTHPIPELDPEVAPFLHGKNSKNVSDVYVVFRSDLGNDPEKWQDVVELCPPSSTEALPVRIWDFQRWLIGSTFSDATGDVEYSDADHPKEGISRKVLRWSGKSDETDVINDQSQVAPGDLYVISCGEGSDLGDFPDRVVTDDAENSYMRARDKAIIRMPDFVLSDDQFEEKDFTGLFDAVKQRIEKDFSHWKEPVKKALASKSCKVKKHPVSGFVISSNVKLNQFIPSSLEEEFVVVGQKQIGLAEHSIGVANNAKRFAEAVDLDGELYYQTGLWHDVGKMDPRFQGLLRRIPSQAVRGFELLAKSEKTPGLDMSSFANHYPRRARHELLSVSMLRGCDDLLLHNTATHHGSARPFGNMVQENNYASPIDREFLGQRFTIESCRQDIESWNEELSNRFWLMVRKFGWWGIVFRETVFRLADHHQSKIEQEDGYKPSTVSKITLVRSTTPSWNFQKKLIGINGGNPLGFLAAIGTMVAIDQWSRSDRSDWLRDVKMSWGSDQSPILHFQEDPPEDDRFTEQLAKSLISCFDNHPSRGVLDYIEKLGEAKKSQEKSDAQHGKKKSKVTFEKMSLPLEEKQRVVCDWFSSMAVEENLGETSLLVVSRRDYFVGQIRQIIANTQVQHLCRTLFMQWDYKDSIVNQTLNLSPSEDRRHAYQWDAPNEDPNRKNAAMLGAYRLAIEAFVMFPCFASSGKLATRGFSDKDWTWPLWCRRLSVDAIHSMLGTSMIKDKPQEFGILRLFQSKRICIGKTPRLTPAIAIA